jgi:uncharacterized phage protein (TIGR01671 family)
MREILFRGKRVDNGEWVEGFYEQTYTYDTNKQLHRILWNDEQTKTAFCADIIPETLGQFTGLTDKNGKRIFEGDIVKCRHHWQLRVYPREGIDEEKYFFAQKIRGAYGKGVDKGNVFIPCERYYYFRNYAVEYFARNGEFRVRNGGCFHPLTRGWIFNRDMEVIGNIHDNGELLTAERREK